MKLTRYPAKRLVLLFCMFSFHHIRLSFCATLEQIKDTHCRDCNVILISVDTLRADALGIYGSKLNYSPNIDRAARKGFVFLNAYAASPVSLPSHMSIFTALYPGRHKMTTIRPLNQAHFLDKRFATLPEILKSNGYKTAWFGPLHHQHLDLTVGFERGFNEFYDNFKVGETAPLEIYGWLDRNATGRFFMFLHTYHMHDPYAPNQSTVRLFSDRLNKKDILSFDELITETGRRILNDPILAQSSGAVANAHSRHQDDSEREGMDAARSSADVSARRYWNRFYEIIKKTHSQQFDVSDPGSLSDLKALYAMSLYDVDRWFSFIRKKLDDLKILDKTLIIIVSDHGEGLMNHGRLRHQDLYEECLHVPLIFLVPEAKKGKKVPELVSNLDILPTVLGLLDISAPNGIQGVSLKPLMDGSDGYPSSRYVYGEFWANSSLAVRDSSFTYISHRFPEPAEEFYDRIMDPHETVNLILSESERAVKYRDLIKNYVEDCYGESGKIKTK